MSHHEARGNGMFRRRRPEAAEMDITPMVDVTVLLLIFTMVGSHVTSGRPVDLPVAEGGVGVATDKGVPVIVRQDDNPVGAAEPRVELDNGRMAGVEELKRYVRERADAGKKEFLIRAERRVPTGLVQQVARAVQEVPGTRFFVAIEEAR
jgi:biopolymer transport protein ExbD